MTQITRPIFRLDTVAVGPIRLRVVIKVEPHADPAKVQVVVWDLQTAWKIERDMERLAAEYEREADRSMLAGRDIDAGVCRGFASSTLTLAADLLLALAVAETKAAA